MRLYIVTLDYGRSIRRARVLARSVSEAISNAQRADYRATVTRCVPA